MSKLVQFFSAVNINTKVIPFVSSVFKLAGIVILAGFILALCGLNVLGLDYGFFKGILDKIFAGDLKTILAAVGIFLIIDKFRK